MDSLLDRFTLSDVSGQSYLQLIRAPEGYFVRVATPGQIGPLREARLFWSASQKKFLPLPFPERSSQDLEHLASYEYNYREAENFARYYFYGYYGYETDAIDTLEPLARRTDRQQLQLARAYADLAMNRLNNQYGTSDPERRFEIDTVTPALSETQLAAYREWQHRAIHHFKQLHRQNPDYPLVVGDPWTKYSNEVMTAYLTLWQYQDERTAFAELRDSLYDPGTLAFAAGMLADCPPDALLFCAGDNDFYPLLYLQKFRGHRPDITLVSYPLLQTPRYREALSRAGLDFHVPARLNAREAISLTFPEKRAASIPLDSLFAYLSDAGRWRMSAAPGTEAYLSLPANRYNSRGVEYPVEAPYVLRRTLNFLDIHHRYQSWRPICFSGVGAAFFQEIWIPEDYWQASGLIYRFSSAAGSPAPFDTLGGVRHLLRGYGELHTEPVRPQFLPFAQRYLQVTVQTALALRDTTLARRLLDRYRISMPSTFHFQDPGSADLAMAYGAIGQTETGLRIARGLALHWLRHPETNPSVARERAIEVLRFLNREWRDPDLSRYLVRLP